MEKKSLNVFLLVGIFVSTILSIRNWPVSAEFGLSSLFFIIMGVVLFLIPVSLISAELATGWPSKGGVFAWIKEAFGNRVAVSASWFIWISNVVWYPTILSFIGSSLAYTISPELAQNKILLCSLIVSTFWGLILLNLKGTKISGWISTVCLLIGTIIPGVLIIYFGIEWAFSGNPVQMDLSPSKIIPKFNNIGDFVFFAGILLGFSGMEMPAAHANEVENPKKTFPRAIFLSVLAIILLSILGTFAVGLVIPQESMSLLSAPLDAMSIFLVSKNLGFLIPVASLFLGLGAMGGVSTWIAGPSKTLLEAAQGMELPKWITKENKNRMPSGIMLFQAIIVTALSMLFFLLPSLNVAYWILTALSSQLYLIAYIALFAAAVYLRYKRPDVERKFRVSKSNLGIWMVSGIGIVNALFAITIGFFPPSQFASGSHFFLLTMGGMLLFSSVPFLVKEKSLAVPV